MSKPKTVKGALPCGNPNRYTSTEVVQMQRKEAKSLSTAPITEDQSESGDYIKTLLKRQIHTDVTLNQQFSQHRTFTESSSHAPSVTKLQGLHTVKEYVRLDKNDSTIEYLKSCGLTNEEIAFKLKDEIPNKTDTSGFGADPAIKEQIATEIERKLAEKEEALKKPDEFNGGLELSRHALVLEKAILERQNKEAALPEFLFRGKKTSASGHPDDPINNIPAILSDIEAKPNRESRRERRRKRKLNQKLLRQQRYLGVDSDPKAHQQFMESVGLLSESQSNDIETSLDSGDRLNRLEDDKAFDKDKQESKDESDRIHVLSRVTDSHICDKDVDQEDSESEDESEIKKKKKNVVKNPGWFTMKDFGGDVTFVRDEDIQVNRLSLSEILSIDRFQHYEQGNPSKTVFVKNLPNSVTEMDLISLFGRFDQLKGLSVLFRLLNGRMKGQAFVTFPDIDTAREAIESLNGYKFHGRPMILSFGKKQM